jgi:hypothetical protein
MALSPSLRCSTRLPRALGPLLDARLGSTVDIQTLYREHAAKYEKEFLEDMTQLGIRPVDVMTRVSEYLPEVVSMCERIIANGFGYDAEGSVYFDTQAFVKAGHSTASWRRGRSATRSCSPRARARSAALAASATRTILRSGRRASRASPSGRRRGATAAPAGTSSARRWRRR